MSGRGSMALALCLASSHALSPRTICSRRGALYGAAAALSHPASVRTSAAAVVPPSSGPTDTTAAADVSARLNAGVRAMDVLLRDWDELTIDCTYAEVPRALLETKNKELLLEKASPCVENKLAQPPASWLSGGYFQHQVVPQAAPSVGQPRPISRVCRAGRPYRAYIRRRRAHWRSSTRAPRSRCASRATGRCAPRSSRSASSPSSCRRPAWRRASETRTSKRVCRTRLEPQTSRP
jgi:hypothetical protein